MIKDYALEIDWYRLIGDKVSDNWEIYPILFHGINRGVLPSPPAEIKSKLKQTYFTLKANAKMQFILIDEILQKAHERGIKVCLLKGAVLSKKYYPDITLRPMGDIDILVRDESRSNIGKILNKMGAYFESSQGSHDRYVFPEAYDTVVEVHFRLINTESILQRIFFPSYFLDKIPWEDMSEMENGGFRLPFSFEYDYLLLHALKEGYKSLKWMIDMALMDNAFKNREKNEVHGKFITNARAIMHDITSILTGEKSYAGLGGCLWRKAVRDGVIGRAGKWERLWLAMSCAIGSPG
jgi:hypothetical protein